jgi:flagellin
MPSANVNTQSLFNARTLDRNQQLLGRSLTRLSSGARLVTPADDAAAIGLSEKLTAQNRRVQAASINVQNAISFVQAVDGFLGGMGTVLSRMSELAVLAGDPLKNANDIQLYRIEFSQLQAQLRNTIGGSTAEIGGTANVVKPLGRYNGLELFGANPSGTIVATGHSSTQRLTIPQTNLRDGAMAQIIMQDASGNFLLDLTDATAFQEITAAVTDLGDERATLGSIGGRLELVAGSLVTEGENLTAALSNILDVDVAAETTRLTKYQMLTQSGAAMLTQATQSPRSVLKLLEG